MNTAQREHLDDEENLPETTWIEDTPTLNNFGHVYGQHQNRSDTPHLHRWIYADRTPVVGILGEWQFCSDCDEREESE